MKVLFQIAFRNAIKNWRHSLAAILSIAAGFISLVLFQGYITNINHMYEDGFVHRGMYGHILIENPILSTPEGRAEAEKHLIPVHEQNLISQFLKQNEQDVNTTVRFLPVTGMVTNGRNSFMFVAMGYDIEAGAQMRAPNWTWETLYGEPLHVANNPQGAVVGQSLGFLLGCVPVQKRTDMVQNNGYTAEVRPFTCERPSVQLTATTISGQLNAMNFDIVGLIDGGYREIDEKYMKISLENAQALLNTDQIRFQSVLLNDKRRVSDFVARFDQFAKTNNMNLKALPWQKHLVGDLYNKTKSLLGIFQVFIVTVILAIASLSVLNTVVKSVKERTREIGTLRSIGYTSQQVGLIFSLEALYLSLMGVGLGVLISVGTTMAVNQSRILYRAGLLSEPVLFRIGYDWNAYWICTVLLSVLAVFASRLATRSTLQSTVAGNLTHV